MKRIHLLACNSCRRQLDVTALHVGDIVQCVCDSVLTVPPPKEVQVRGLACGRCGGALGEEDTTCTYCQAALSPEERRETLLCPLCAVRLPDDSRHCKTCGVELRAAALPPLPKDGKCPRCDGPLRVHLLEDAEVIECSRDTGCGGLWCSRETFERLQRTATRAVAEGQTGRPEVPRFSPEGTVTSPSTGNERQYLPCLGCSDLMQRRQFRVAGRASGIVLDVCADHGVWFDEGELEKALGMVRAHMEVGEPLGRSRLRAAPSPKLTAPLATKRRSVAMGSLESVLDFLAQSLVWSPFD